MSCKICNVGNELAIDKDDIKICNNCIKKILETSHVSPGQNVMVKTIKNNTLCFVARSMIRRDPKVIIEKCLGLYSEDLIASAKKCLVDEFGEILDTYDNALWNEIKKNRRQTHTRPVAEVLVKDIWECLNMLDGYKIQVSIIPEEGSCIPSIDTEPINDSIYNHRLALIETRLAELDNLKRDNENLKGNVHAVSVKLDATEVRITELESENVVLKAKLLRLSAPLIPPPPPPPVVNVVVQEVDKGVVAVPSAADDVPATNTDTVAVNIEASTSSTVADNVLESMIGVSSDDHSGIADVSATNATHKTVDVKRQAQFKMSFKQHKKVQNDSAQAAIQMTAHAVATGIPIANAVKIGNLVNKDMIQSYSNMTKSGVIGNTDTVCLPTGSAQHPQQGSRTANRKKTIAFLSLYCLQISHFQGV